MATIGQANSDGTDLRINTVTLGDGATAPVIRCGTGSPEGILSAPPDSVYLGAGLWIKESGTGSTGWKLVTAYTPPAPPSTGYRAEVIVDGPVSYWRLGESAGPNAIDEMTANAGVYTGGVTFAQTGAIVGDTDKAALFTRASAGYVTVSDSASLSITGSWTIEAWIKLATISDGTTQNLIAAKYDAAGGGSNGYLFRVSVGNKLESYTLGASTMAGAVGATSLSAGTWYYAVAVYNGTTLKVYLNGVEDGTVSTTIAPTNGSAAAIIGGQPDLQAASFLNGTLDEVAIYNKALSTTRITAHYSAGTTGAVNTPIAPTAPTAYSLPGTYTAVTTTAGLITALGNGAVTNIVLEDGTYDNAAPLTLNGITKKLYARNLLGAIVRFCFLCGSAGSGAHEFHGIEFRVAASGDIAGKWSPIPGTSSAIFVYGVGGQNTLVADCKINGLLGGGPDTIGGYLACGIAGIDSGIVGTILQRLRIENCYDAGIRLQWPDINNTTQKISRIEDIDVSNVSYRYDQTGILSFTGPGSSNGTGESGLIVGAPVTNVVARIKTREVAMANLLCIRSCYDSTFRDLDLGGRVRGSGGGTIGIYCEHKSKRNIFEKFLVGPNLNSGVQNEWDGNTAGNGASYDNIVRNGTINTNLQAGTTGGSQGTAIAGATSRWGVHAGQGTTNLTVTNCVFQNSNYACIVDQNTSGCVYSNNDYSGRVLGTPTILPG